MSIKSHKYLHCKFYTTVGLAVYEQVSLLDQEAKKSFYLNSFKILVEHFGIVWGNEIENCNKIFQKCKLKHF